MEKNYNYKAEERKAFFRYFRVWMIVAAISLGVFGILFLIHREQGEAVHGRNNDRAPSQRVYDFADVLTDDAEKRLTDLISKCEEQGECDIILVTIDQPVGLSDAAWDRGMVNIADDFYDQNAFGYNRPYGDGALLLDNWYHAGQSDSQAGAWLSTSGKMEDIIGKSEERTVFRAFDDGLEVSTEEAYARAIKKIAQFGQNDSNGEVVHLPWFLVPILPLIVALIFAFSNMKQVPGKDTTNPTTYVPNGNYVMRAERNDFIRKSVSKVKIQTESSSGGSRSGGGGGSYGHHISSGGRSHGGGGHRR